MLALAPPPFNIPVDRFQRRFPTRILYALLLYPIRAACPVHLILLDFTLPTILSEG